MTYNEIIDKAKDYAVSIKNPEVEKAINKIFNDFKQTAVSSNFALLYLIKRFTNEEIIELSKNVYKLKGNVIKELKELYQELYDNEFKINYIEFFNSDMSMQTLINSLPEPFRTFKKFNRKHGFGLFKTYKGNKDILNYVKLAGKLENKHINMFYNTFDNLAFTDEKYKLEILAKTKAFKYFTGLNFNPYIMKHIKNEDFERYIDGLFTYDPRTSSKKVDIFWIFRDKFYVPQILNSQNYNFFYKDKSIKIGDFICGVTYSIKYGYDSIAYYKTRRGYNNEHI